MCDCFLYSEEIGSVKSQRGSAEQNYFKAAVIQVLPSIKAHILRVREELFWIIEPRQFRFHGNRFRNLF